MHVNDYSFGVGSAWANVLLEEMALRLSSRQQPVARTLLSLFSAWPINIMQFVDGRD